ncbi:MAG TPA: DUF1343 domain-containing protein [Verrucomicrobia bacterium]|nr:DUF1343 domain-containing protein [Verrucomicrobiota bacterium]
MTVDHEQLLRDLESSTGPLGLLTMQATRTAFLLARRFPGRLKALYSAEHGFFGALAPGENAADARHPFLGLPICSLYGAHRKPTPGMLAGVSRMVIDLCDIGVRCYTYLATLKNTLEACAEAHIPVTVLDRPIPLGDVVDGPLVEPGRESFVAPIGVPLCHGMTPGECALWIREAKKLDLDLRVVRLEGWSHARREPWANFMPPSPAIRSWDSAALYPATVFTEAYPAVDCDRQGALAFRVLGAPWLDARAVMEDLEPGLSACGVEMRPYRYACAAGASAGSVLDGILLSTSPAAPYRPVRAGVLILAALLRRHAEEMAAGARPEWLAKLMGTETVGAALRGGDLEGLFHSWDVGRAAYLPTRVNLYAEGVDRL